ncbi:hypothetical protein EYF80_049841 [Liparis tanakae]|uniref:Uncharacterized protein n=1 Tax=Liparis tanakae TaxID=230148 RepID=A0A4Z2FFQ6_9TELE|nr:hypothetical protein EYF80_049841 [Liparis tanakae]
MLSMHSLDSLHPGRTVQVCGAVRGWGGGVGGVSSSLPRSVAELPGDTSRQPCSGSTDCIRRNPGNRSVTWRHSVSRLRTPELMGGREGAREEEVRNSGEEGKKVLGSRLDFELLSTSAVTIRAAGQDTYQQVRMLAEVKRMMGTGRSRSVILVGGVNFRPLGSTARPTTGRRGASRDLREENDNNTFILKII